MLQTKFAYITSRPTLEVCASVQHSNLNLAKTQQFSHWIPNILISASERPDSKLPTLTCDSRAETSTIKLNMKANLHRFPLLHPTKELLRPTCKTINHSQQYLNSRSVRDPIRSSCTCTNLQHQMWQD
ncbi:hypothetical protein AVEN_58826-1 [Araneus ventricosus]|uniref:Uncharacterized protein n=1 Tax=Araneus ventricosus TaxID=182803 RepID=A0A4Y2TXL8_ARAVE|nr:hypothetical protein AVEN_58826-1 [Araneus ventricosus]